MSWIMLTDPADLRGYEFGAKIECPELVLIRMQLHDDHTLVLVEAYSNDSMLARFEHKEEIRTRSILKDVYAVAHSEYRVRVRAQNYHQQLEGIKTLLIVEACKFPYSEKQKAAVKLYKLLDKVEYYRRPYPQP